MTAFHADSSAQNPRRATPRFVASGAGFALPKQHGVQRPQSLERQCGPGLDFPLHIASGSGMGGAPEQPGGIVGLPVMLASMTGFAPPKGRWGSGVGRSRSNASTPRGSTSGCACPPALPPHRGGRPGAPRQTAHPRLGVRHAHRAARGAAFATRLNSRLLAELAAAGRRPPSGSGWRLTTSLHGSLAVRCVADSAKSHVVAVRLFTHTQRAHWPGKAMYGHKRLTRPSPGGDRRPPHRGRGAAPGCSPSGSMPIAASTKAARRQLVELEVVRARLAAAVAALTGVARGLDEARLHQERCCSPPRPTCARNSTAFTPMSLRRGRSSAKAARLGRRLDFLAQEFSREANTLGAEIQRRDADRARASTPRQNSAMA